MGMLIQNDMIVGGGIILKNMVLEKKTLSATTTASGNINLNLDLSKYTVVSINVKGKTDTMAIPCSWGSSSWGAHICGIGATMSPVTNTTVTVDVLYTTNSFKEKTVTATTTASGNINLELPLTTTMPYRVVVYNEDGSFKADAFGVIGQWSTNYWCVHCCNLDLSVLDNQKLMVKCYYTDL